MSLCLDKLERVLGTEGPGGLQAASLACSQLRRNHEPQAGRRDVSGRSELSVWIKPQQDSESEGSVKKSAGENKVFKTDDIHAVARVDVVSV